MQFFFDNFSNNFSLSAYIAINTRLKKDFFEWPNCSFILDVSAPIVALSAIKLKKGRGMESKFDANIKLKIAAFFQECAEAEPKITPSEIAKAASTATLKISRSSVCHMRRVIQPKRGKRASIPRADRFDRILKAVARVKEARMAKVTLGPTSKKKRLVAMRKQLKAAKGKRGYQTQAERVKLEVLDLLSGL